MSLSSPLTFTGRISAFLALISSTTAIPVQVAVSLYALWLLYSAALRRSKILRLSASRTDRADKATIEYDILTTIARSSSAPLAAPPAQIEGAVQGPRSETRPAHEQEQIPSKRGSAVRHLCRAIASKNVDRAYKILKISPSFVSIRHPLGWRPFHVAIMSGDVNLVRHVLFLPNMYTDISATDEGYTQSYPTDAFIENAIRSSEFHAEVAGVDTRGASALHFACLGGRWEVIKAVLDAVAYWGAGPGFEDVDLQGRKPSEYFDLDCVDEEVLIAYEEAYETWRREQELFEPRIEKLSRAVKKKDYDTVKKMLDWSTDSLTSLNQFGWSLLHQASINADAKMLSLLLSYCKDDDLRSNWLNSTDDWHYYNVAERLRFASNTLPHQKMKAGFALHYACLVGDLDSVEVLLRAGANWDLVDYDSRDAKTYIFWGRDELTEDNRILMGKYTKLVEEEKNRREGMAAAVGEDSESESDESINVHIRESGTFADTSIEDHISDKIIGQRGPVRSVANAIRLREHGWVDPNRPLVMLFLGSSGVGKTEVAKQVASYLANKDVESAAEAAGEKPQFMSIREVEAAGGFVRVDMSEYQDSHTIYNLFGAPKGYVGYYDGGMLTKKLKANPKAIVLLDEIEKAHPDVLTVFLQVFDDGRLTDSQEGTILCHDAVFIMTSNLASDEIREAAPRLRALIDATIDRPEEYNRVVTEYNRDIHPILKGGFKRDEFLGRINQIVVFLPLSEEEISIIINNKLREWQKRAEASHTIRLTWSPSVVEKLVGAYDRNFGARSVIHEVERIAVQLVADAQIQGVLKHGWLAHLYINDGGDIDLVAADSKEPIPLRRGCRYDFF